MGCGFRGRAVWLAQELLAVLESDVGSLALIPGSGGVLIVRVGEDVVFSNKDAGRFPEPRELKDALREKLGLTAVPRHG